MSTGRNGLEVKTHLFSRRILNTFLASFASFVIVVGPPARGGNAPGHRSCRSASDSFVPSVSTTIVPYHPGSTKRPGDSGIGIRAGDGGRRGPLEDIDMRCFEGARMTKEERCTQRTTLWMLPCGLEATRDLVLGCQIEVRRTYVSVRTRSCRSWRLAAISWPQGARSMWTTGLVEAGPVRMTRWK